MADAIAHGQGPGAGKEDPAGLGARSTAPFCVSASVMGKIYIFVLQYTVSCPHTFSSVLLRVRCISQFTKTYKIVKSESASERGRTAVGTRRDVRGEPDSVSEPRVKTGEGGGWGDAAPPLAAGRASPCGSVGAGGGHQEPSEGRDHQ